MTTAHIALGSNLGDRQRNLDQALDLLRARPGIVVSAVSSYHETEPVGGPAGQGPYLNAAAELQTELSPADLLRVLLDVEQQLGRVRAERFGPRTIDLDLVLYGDAVVNQADVIVPHPRMHERRFVLQPLAEIAPGAVHPLLKRTVADLLAGLPPEIPQAPPGRGPSSAVTTRKPGRLPPSPDVPPLPEAPPEPAPAGRELAGRRALVTGSTRGIGRAIALELARAGADVVVHGRDAAAAEQVAEAVRAEGGRSRVLLADLHDEEERDRLVSSAWWLWDGLDIWINNAGSDTLTGEAAHWPFARKLHDLLAVDVVATILLSRAVGARMKEQGGGVVLTMGWDQAETGMEGDSGQLFGATKGALMAFTRSLALTLAPEVRVNCLAPGWIRTAWGETASESWQERVRRETPLGRWGRPQDVAAAARWVVSPAAAFITGQIIRINGGAVR